MSPNIDGSQTEQSVLAETPQPVGNARQHFGHPAILSDYSLIKKRLSHLTLSAGLQADRVTASLVFKRKKSGITPDVRSRQVRKLVQAIFPAPVDAAVDYANTIEAVIYEMAHSRAEYVQLIREKSCKLWKELERQQCEE